MANAQPGTRLVTFAILSLLAVFLLYPIAYVVPSALGETGAPYRVILSGAGAQQDKLLEVLGAAGQNAAQPTEPTSPSLESLPLTVADGRSLSEALALAQRLRDAGATVRIEGTTRPSAFFVRQVFANPFLWECFASSLTVSVGATLLATLISLPLALWFTRLRFPGRGLLAALVLVPLILPPFVGAIGFRQIFSRFGSLNLWLLDAGIIDHPIDWLGKSGLWGLVLLEALHLYPIMYLNLSAALANVDPTLEEAARNLGASERRIFWRVTFPLVLPGYFAGASIVFIWAFTDLGTPIVLGYRGVVAYQVFERLTEAESNPLGYALVLVTLVLTAGLYSLTRWLTGRRQFAMVAKGGVGSSAARASAGKSLLVLGYGLALTFVAVLPHLAVVLTSVSGKWSMTAMPSEYTSEYFALALTHKLAGLSVRNSVLYSACSTIADIVLGVTIAYLVARRASWSSKLLDTLSMLPLALPGLVLAFGYLTCFQPVANWLEGLGLGELSELLQPQKSPVLLLIMAYAIRRLPYMTRAALAGLQQTAVTFEEAAENLGASRWYVTRRIVLPLIAANIVAGSILTFSFAVLEVSDSLMLAQRENYFPMTKAIYWLLGRPDDGPYIASAMGVIGMVLLAGALVAATAILGRRLGELFRA